jgi:hypothetical protein
MHDIEITFAPPVHMHTKSKVHTTAYQLIYVDVPSQVLPQSPNVSECLGSGEPILLFSMGRGLDLGGGSAPSLLQELLDKELAVMMWNEANGRKNNDSDHLTHRSNGWRC